LGTVVGVVVTLTLGLALVVAAFFLAVALGSRGLFKDEWSPQLLLIGTPLLTLGLAACVGLVCEAWFIKRRGGARPMIAAITSVAAAWTVAMLAALVELTSVAVGVAGAATHVALLAKRTSQRAQPRADVGHLPSPPALDRKPDPGRSAGPSPLRPVPTNCVWQSRRQSERPSMPWAGKRNRRCADAQNPLLSLLVLGVDNLQTPNPRWRSLRPCCRCSS